jgi:hypothetical protein
MAIYPCSIVTPPSTVDDKERWRRINAQRLRCEYWWLTSTALKTVGWLLAISTVIVAGITAGRPGFIDWTNDGTVRTFQTAVAILSGLSGLIPWRKTGRDFERAHEMLRDAIMLYDADTTYTVMHVLEQAHKAADELHLDERKTPDATLQTKPSPASAPKGPHQ